MFTLYHWSVFGQNFAYFLYVVAPNRKQARKIAQAHYGDLALWKHLEAAIDNCKPEQLTNVAGSVTCWLDEVDIRDRPVTLSVVKRG